jgi:hypothetical protein
MGYIISYKGITPSFVNCMCMKVKEKEHELLMEQVMAKLEHIDST